MVSWLMLGSKSWPQTSQSPIETLPLLAASVFSVSLTKIYSAIIQPRLALKPYYQFVRGLNSLFVWFQRWVWLADGVVSWWTPCLIGAKKVGLVGAIFTSSNHLSVLPWQKKHRPHAPSWSSVATGVARAPYWLLPLQQWQRCQCNASMMHHTLNSLINIINDN
jgi:hypothetical protein